MYALAHRFCTLMASIFELLTVNGEFVAASEFANAIWRSGPEQPLIDRQGIALNELKELNERLGKVQSAIEVLEPAAGDQIKRGGAASRDQSQSARRFDLPSKTRYARQLGLSGRTLQDCRFAHRQ